MLLYLIALICLLPPTVAYSDDECVDVIPMTNITREALLTGTWHLVALWKPENFPNMGVECYEKSLKHVTDTRAEVFVTVKMKQNEELFNSTFHVNTVWDDPEKAIYHYEIDSPEDSQQSNDDHDYMFVLAANPDHIVHYHCHYFRSLDKSAGALMVLGRERTISKESLQNITEKLPELGFEDLVVEIELVQQCTI